MLPPVDHAVARGVLLDADGAALGVVVGPGVELAVVVRVLDLLGAQALLVEHLPVDHAVAVGVVLLARESAALVDVETIDPAVVVAVDLHARAAAVLVAREAVRLAVVVRVLGARADLAVLVAVLGIELAVEVGVLRAADQLAGLLVEDQLDFGLAVAVGVERLRHAPAAVLAGLHLEQGFGDLALVGGPRRRQHVAHLGLDPPLLLLAKALVERLLAVDGLEQLLLPLELRLDLGLELVLLHQLVLDLLLEGRVGIHAAGIAPGGAAGAIQRHVAGDQAVEAEQGGADSGAVDARHLTADHCPHDHALEAGLEVLTHLGAGVGPRLARAADAAAGGRIAALRGRIHGGIRR